MKLNSKNLHLETTTSISCCRAYLNPTGNWCGHNPLSPKFFVPNSAHKRRPDAIQWAMLNLERFYDNPAKWLPSLRLARASNRKERSEGREREADVIGVMLHYTELASLRVGVPQENGCFLSFDMKFFAKKLGWRSDKDDEDDRKRIEQGKSPKNRGIKRVWRSINELKKSGYITVHKRFEKFLDEEQNYSGLPAVKCIQPKLFYELGISRQKLTSKRKEASKRLKKKYIAYLNKLEKNIKKGGTSAVQAVLNFGKNAKQKYARSSKYYDERRINSEKVRVQRLEKLKKLPENQNLSADEFYNKYPKLTHEQWHKRE